MLDVEVHVLPLDRPREAVGTDLLADLAQAALDGGEIVGRNDLRAREHAGMGDRALDVEGREAPVEGDGGVEAPRERVERLREAARPCLAGARGARRVVWLHGIGADGQMGIRGEYKSDGCDDPVAELLQPGRDAALA